MARRFPHADRDELAQAAMLKLLQVATPGKSKKYLMTVAVRAMSDEIRVGNLVRVPHTAFRHRRDATVAKAQVAMAWQSLPCTWDRAAHEHDEEDRWAAVRHAVLRLPDPYRFVVQCRLRGETFREIGAAIGVSRQVAMLRWAEAVRMLREMVGHDFVEQMAG